MRQGQQNKRMRGRGRKMPNALNRVYESNGPDVKVRGTAAHIAEKYQALSRDAQSSGDTVAAENYMQHAEHYLRLIAASQAQLAPQAQPQSPHGGMDVAAGEAGDDAPAFGNGAAREEGDETEREAAAAEPVALNGEAAQHHGGRRRRRGGGGPLAEAGGAGADETGGAVETVEPVDGEHGREPGEAAETAA